MQTSRQIASHLLGVERIRSSGALGKVRSHPLVFGFFNLFFCGYFDQYLRNDAAGNYLSLFLFFESALLTILAIVSFRRSGELIVHNATIFPTTSWSRFLYILRCITKHPAIVFVWGTNILFLFVFYRGSSIVMSMAAMLFTALSLDIIGTVSIILLIRNRAVQSLIGLAGLGACIAWSVIVISSGSRLNVFAWIIPFILPATHGIIAAQQGNIEGACLQSALLLSAFVVTLFIGRKLS